MSEAGAMSSSSRPNPLGSGHNTEQTRTGSNPAAHRSLTPNQRAWRRFTRNRAALVSAGFLLGLLVLILVGPWLSGYRPELTYGEQFQAPNAKHWFGTDVHGRDLLIRVLYGARISLLVGLVGAGVALVIGVTWGAVAGYVGGRLDSLMMRTVDVLYSLPSIIFVMVLMTTLTRMARSWFSQFPSPLGPKLVAAAPLLFLFVGLGAVSWLTMARIVRGQVLTLRTRAFVEASRCLGASHAHILWRHILPNVWGLVIVYLTLTVPAVILYESFLSYLGLGIQPPMASWGSLVAQGANQLNPVRVYWWLLVFPSSCLVLTLLALNFFGDGLRDAFDPRAAEE